MKSFEAFKTALAESSAGVVQSFLERRWDDLPGVVRSYFGKRVDLTHVTTSSTEEFAIKLVHGLAAIESSLECLRDVEAYLAAVPDGVEQLRCIYLLVETYLNEMVVLRDRVQAYYKCIPKLYRRDPIYPQLLGVASGISVSFEHLIDEILNLEDKHILGEQCRDEHLDVLLALSFYAVRPGEAALGRFENGTRSVLAGWQANVAGSNRRIFAQLDEGFAALGAVLISPAGRLIQPRRV
ncbi:MAG: hypothetical protein BWY87_00984 [Deltaproteobacteria bacterium ADurb.Bin510]|nr:MAG: hypothetical protein BWY87_00984 [Deltaproteobacteria bacterium ADurb.Bin510]